MQHRTNEMQYGKFSSRIDSPANKNCFFNGQAKSKYFGSYTDGKYSTIWTVQFIGQSHCCGGYSGKFRKIAADAVYTEYASPLDWRENGCLRKGTAGTA